MTIKFYAVNLTDFPDPFAEIYANGTEKSVKFMEKLSLIKTIT